MSDYLLYLAEIAYHMPMLACHSHSGVLSTSTGLLGRVCQGLNNGCGRSAPLDPYVVIGADRTAQPHQQLEPRQLMLGDLL